MTPDQIVQSTSSHLRNILRVLCYNRTFLKQVISTHKRLDTHIPQETYDNYREVKADFILISKLQTELKACNRSSTDVSEITANAIRVIIEKELGKAIASVKINTINLESNSMVKQVMKVQLDDVERAIQRCKTAQVREQVKVNNLTAVVNYYL